jgi:hypothetical protein
MAITKRSDKGSALTYQEMDDNFDAIALPVLQARDQLVQKAICVLTLHLNNLKVSKVLFGLA